MSQITLDIGEFHWALQVLDTLDSGLIVIDSEYTVCIWNTFMQNYSNISADQIMGKNLFETCDSLPEKWLKAKIATATMLETRSFSCWEERPFVFDFHNFAPIAQGVSQMYQNIVITPLKSLTGVVTHLAISIQDVTDIAISKLSLESSNQQLAKIGRTDGLTGLYNRTHWENRSKEVFEHSSQSDLPATVVIFDIDHFKKVNDTYGHAVGDDVIRHASKILLKSARQSDICGRYGGEEFTVLLPGTTAEQAMYFVERLRQRIENAEVPSTQGVVKFTVSLGLCELNENITDHVTWLSNADQALYQSKQAGRNRSSIFGSTEQI